MKVPRLKLENLMALDVADAGVLKCNVVRLLLKHPQGIKYGDFSGAFYRFHGHHLQLALHGYSSLKYLLTDMKNTVVLEKDSQVTVIKLANGVPFNKCLDDKEGWDCSEGGSGSSKEEMQSQRNDEAEDAAEPCSPTPLLDRGFTVSDSILQKMEQKTFLATVVVPIYCILRHYPKGLDLCMMMETLKKRGFDLERLSQDVGYSDTIHCLLEMSMLRLTFFNGMVPQNCVVKLLSSSPHLPARPFNAGCSLHKPLSSNASTTFPQHFMKTKPVSHSSMTSRSSMTSQASASPSCDLYHSLSKSKTWAQIVLGKKPAYHSSSTSQSSASFSCHSESSAGKSKTLKQSVPRKKAAPAEVLELLTNLINTYLFGVTIRELQEFLLGVMGFDLEKFSIAQGYKDTLEFLEDQIPELQIEYSKKRLQCVVKQGQGIRKKQKKYQRGRKKLTKSPEESLALLTNLLKTEKSGMRVKKLQELLLALAGFDMEKFCIAQGYVDTLGYLEHQMPELHITYCGNRLDCVVKKGQGRRKEQKTCQGSEEEMTKTLAEVLAFLTKLLKTFTSGLQVKKLQTFFLTLKGFDLQKFTTAKGYKDILEFLEHQMPELNFKYCGSRLNCIVKQGQGKRKEQKTYQHSQEETSKRQGKRKEQKTCQCSQEEMTEILAEVLALLTKLLKTYTSRTQIKKLQQFLLTVKGFDLQKFTIAQGYNDMLEFLEYQLLELNITYCGNRLECIFKKGQGEMKEQKTCQGSQEETTETLAEVLTFLTKLLKTYTLTPRIKKLQEFLLTVEGFDLQKLTIAQDCKDILEFLEHQMPELNFKYCGKRLECIVKKGQGKRKKQKTCHSQEEMKEKGQDSQIEIAEQTMEILETQSRSNNLLFRGISKDFGRQNLEERFRELLQDYLKIQGNFLVFGQIFRVNPGFEFKNKLPQDILVHFTHKKTRDAILKKHRESPFKVAEKEVQIFQDLPTSVLRKRKDFYFLRDILQEKGIRYHWKIPFAIDVNLPKERKVIKTVEQAKLLAEELQASHSKSSSKP